jgi:hypothetical protein
VQVQAFRKGRNFLTLKENNCFLLSGFPFSVADFVFCVSYDFVSFFQKEGMREKERQKAKTKMLFNLLRVNQEMQ